MDDLDLLKFLKAISEVESSGGKNIKHREMKDGIHSGDAAYGRYGIMPNTAKEIIYDRKNKDFRKAIGHSGNVEDTLKKNDMAIAEKLATKLKETTGGDPESMAAGWLYGHNLPPEKMKAKTKDDAYVKKFMEAYSKLKDTDVANRAMLDERGMKDVVLPDKELNLIDYLKNRLP